MTDLERAYALVHSDPEHIEAALAAARRESAEQASGEIRALRKALHDETMKRLASAAEMRERAAQRLLNGSFLHDEAPAARLAQEAADAIRALPLTPEEPPKRQPVAPSADPAVSVCGRLIASHPIVIPDLSFENMKAVNAALAAAERRGAEEMRERAAQTVLAGSRGGIRGEIAAAIRTLPLTPEDDDLNPASCQQGMPCGDTDNCPDPVGCGFEMPPVSEDVMADDVVAELNRWLAVWSSHFGGTQSVDMEVVQRARDEIVALREAMTHDSAAIATLCNHARAEALEEAALECEARFCDGCADAIRLLKEKH